MYIAGDIYVNILYNFTYVLNIKFVQNLSIDIDRAPTTNKRLMFVLEMSFA